MPPLPPLRGCFRGILASFDGVVSVAGRLFVMVQFSWLIGGLRFSVIGGFGSEEDDGDEKGDVEDLVREGDGEDDGLENENWNGFGLIFWEAGAVGLRPSSHICFPRFEPDCTPTGVSELVGA